MSSDDSCDVLNDSDAFVLMGDVVLVSIVGRLLHKVTLQGTSKVIVKRSVSGNIDIRHIPQSWPNVCGHAQ